MAVVTAEQEKEMVISPNLDDVEETTEGVYYIQNVWRIDEATGMPVGTTHNVTLT
jgi:hypothetical protein